MAPHTPLTYSLPYGVKCQLCIYSKDFDNTVGSLSSPDFSYHNQEIMVV